MQKLINILALDSFGVSSAIVGGIKEDVKKDTFSGFKL